MPNETNTNNRFSASSHFCADVSTISQSASQIFGPVSEDVFRLTTKFTVTSGTKAYAICPGIVAIQPQTGSTTKVNLILRPYRQPIKGVNVRYFIYRGLTKSDFIDSSGNIIATSSGSSDFIQKINTDFNDFHANEEEPPVFEAAFIGYHETIADLNASFDDLFFSLTQFDEEGEEIPETAFELPKIDQGKTLGTFIAGECGIDVILQYGDYILDEADRFVFDYNYARANEALIDLTGITDEVVRKRRKEQVFQFIDVAAFYGFHCIEDGSVTTAGDVKHDQTTIYDQVLSPFYSKNTYYLYIQSDRARSYDFYGNYHIDTNGPENMSYGIEENYLITRIYETNGWPLILEVTPQEHDEERNKIYIQLVTDNNPNTLLYGQTACVDNALRNHFSTIEELKQSVDENGDQQALTNTIILSNPAVEDGSVKKHISSFGILIYQGKMYTYISGTETNEDTTINKYSVPNFFDDVFGELISESLYESNEESSFEIIISNQVKLINHISSDQQLGASAVNTMIVKDSLKTGEDDSTFGRVIYITETIDVCTDTVSVVGKVSSNTSTSVTQSIVNQQKTYELEYPLYEKVGLMTESNQTITTVELLSLESNIISKIILGIGNEENQILLDLIAANELLNSKLFLIDQFSNDDLLTSGEGIQYKKYKAAIVGEDIDGSLKLAQPTDPIFIYSLDDKYHFSKSYSDHVTSVGNYYLIYDETK